MIAADSSSIIAYFGGSAGPDVELIGAALEGHTLMLPPPVVSELYTGFLTNAGFEEIFEAAQILPLTDGFWRRAGETRGQLLAKGLKARFPDALIAQSCIDAGIPLITRDTDYRHFAKWCGLVLA